MPDIATINGVAEDNIATYNGTTAANVTGVLGNTWPHFDGMVATGGTIIEKNKTKTNITIRNSGSAALDMAYVAAGRFDGYFQKNLNIWDIAAGLIIVKEAGGIINEIDLKKNNNIKVLASSSSINDKLVENLVNF